MKAMDIYGWIATAAFAWFGVHIVWTYISKMRRRKHLED